MTKDRIIERIQKLLNLAGNNPNEIEREAAMKKALAILAEHNLEMSDVQENDQSEEVGQQRKEGRTGPWARSIYEAIGRLYFCRYVYVNNTWPKKHTVHVFIGKDGNAAIAHEMAKWVSEALWAEGLKGKRELNMNNSYLTSFLNSASVTIQNRVNTIIRKAKEDGLKGTTGTALVVSNLYDQAAEANALYVQEVVKPRVGRSSGMSFDNMAGTVRGADYAKTIGLNNQIEKS